jgi:2-methylcitrate dehydratase
VDKNVALIADYAHALRYSDLPADVVHHCKQIVVDTFGVALGAFDAEPCVIARDMALRTSVASGACVLGTDHRTLPELAAFANGVMTRYLDGNDAYPGGGGHPSDVIAAILAAADVKGASGQDVITAIVLAYEVFYAIWATTNLRHKGMDNVFYGTIGGAVGAAKVLGLDRKRMAEAVSLSIVPNVSLDATRYGNLSMWKGCAAGNGARNGVFAALLAEAGLTGPEKPIEGEHGLEKLSGAFKLAPFAGAGRPYRICESTLKYFLSEGHSLSPITVALQLSKQVNVDDIEKVTVYTYWFAWDVIGKEPEKWRPTTREAADHSMPYIIAATLIDRAFSDEVFADERLRDPRIQQLMDKIEVKEDKEITRQFPDKLKCRIEIATKGGGRKIAETDYPRGHYKNPMNDDEVNTKFRGLAQRALSKDGVERALDALWQLDSAKDLGAIFKAVKVTH